MAYTIFTSFIAESFIFYTKLYLLLIILFSTGSDYKNLDNLHIGVTSSKGIVYEYDIDGLQKNKTSQWTRSLTIRDLNNKGMGKQLKSSSIDKSIMDSWNQYWDFTLEVISGQNSWTKEK